MDKITRTKALIDNFRLSEGTEFKCDEEAVFNECETQEENKSSLAIKVLSIFGGFLATLAFIGFLFIAGLYNSEFGLLIFGIGFIISAIWLNKEYDKLIIDTFSISIYVIGFFLLSRGLTEMKVDESVITILILIIAFFSLIVTQNFILSFISVLTISSSLLTLINLNEIYDLIHLYIAVCTLLLTYLMLNEAKIISSNQKLSKLYNPVRIGLIFSLLFGLITIGVKDLIPISQNRIWLSSIVMIAVILYLVYTIIKINGIESTKDKALIYALSAIILISTIFSPSISGAIVIILLSFLVNYKTGLAIGIISIIYFVSQYYYDLSFTLLTKSIMLIVSGIMFLIFYFFTTKKLSSNEEV